MNKNTNNNNLPAKVNSVGCRQADGVGDGERVGLVLEIETAKLPSDLRAVLIQLFEFPSVFTRGEFLKKTGVIRRSYGAGITAALDALPVRDFEYVALIEKPGGAANSVIIRMGGAVWRRLQTLGAGILHKAAVFNQ